MYFKIKKGTETFKKIQEVKEKIDAAEKQAAAFVKTLPGSKGHCGDTNAIGGGVAAVEFNEKPEGWKVVGQTWQKFFMPKYDKKMKPLWEKINALPTVDAKEINQIVDFSAMQMVSAAGGGIAIIKSVGMVFGKEYMLMEVAKGCKFEPNKDMVEILESEFEKLKPKDKK